jgi:hypothetical protein
LKGKKRFMNLKYIFVAFYEEFEETNCSYEFFSKNHPSSKNIIIIGAWEVEKSFISNKVFQDFLGGWS